MNGDKNYFASGTTSTKLPSHSFKEVMRIYKNSSYSRYIEESLQDSNVKWIYPILSAILIFEILVNFKILAAMLAQDLSVQRSFMLLSVTHIALGYVFLSNSKEKFLPRNKNLSVLFSIAIFILFQYYFYSFGFEGNYHFFYFVLVVATISLFPAVKFTYLSYLLLLNMVIFGANCLVHTESSVLMRDLLYAFYISLFGILLSFYYFTSKVTLLINSKKVSVFAEQMAKSNDKLNYLNDKLEKMSLTDGLTKIKNRRAYDIFADQLWSQCIRTETYITIMILDLDHFKQYNDFFGHSKGDECLYAVAQTLQKLFKRKNDIVARIGGEEFIIVLSDVNLTNAKNLATRVLNALEDLKIEHPLNSASKYVSASIGLVSLVPQKDVTLNAAFSYADKALYQAKLTGRNKYSYNINLHEATEINYQEKIAALKNKRLKSSLTPNSPVYIYVDCKSGKTDFPDYIFDVINVKRSALNSISDLRPYVYDKDLDAFDIFSKKISENDCEDEDIKLRILFLNNEFKWVYSQSRIIYDDNNTPLLIEIAVRNIDKERKMETLVNDLMDGNFAFNISDKTGFVKGEIINAIAHEDDFISFNSWYDFIHKDDVVIFDDFVNRFVIENNGTKSLDYRIRLTDNSYAWVSTRNRIHFDYLGEPHSIYGTITKVDFIEREDFIPNPNVNSVTKFPRRVEFNTYLEKILKKGTKGFLFLIDIDNFSNINYIFGHSAGDCFLESFSQRLKEYLIFDNVIHHFSDDVFAIVFKDLSEENSQIQLKKFKTIDETPICFNNKTYDFTVSIAGIQFPEYGRTIDDILRSADISLKKLKSGGKNNYFIFEQSLLDENLHKMYLERDLRKSVYNNMENFTLNYHPLICTKTNTCIGAEVLLRWYSEENKGVPPNIFVPILERMGLMNKVGEWVYKEATTQCKKWISLAKTNDNVLIDENFAVSINVSPHQLAEDDFFSTFISHIENIDLCGKNITLELTENSLIMDIEKASKILNAIREREVRVAIDDFGVGYSSLGYFRDLPVDEIKIDKSFVSDIENDKFLKEFVASIIKIAQSIDRIICVEGVETEAQANILKEFNADLLQGYLFSMPLCKEDFEKIYIYPQV